MVAVGEPFECKVEHGDGDVMYVDCGSRANDNATARIGELEKEMAELREQNEILKKKNNDIQVETEQIRKEYDNLRTLQEKLQSQLEHAITKQAQTNSAKVNANTTLATLQTEKAQLQKQLDAIITAQKQINATKSDVNAQRASELQALQNVGLENAATIKALQEQLKTTVINANSKKSEYDSLATVLSNCQADLQAKQQEIANLKRELQQCNEAKDKADRSLKEQLKNSQVEKSQLAAQLQKETEDYTQISTQIKQMEQQFKTCQIDASKLNTEKNLQISTLKKQLEIAKNNAATAVQKNNNANAQRDKDIAELKKQTILANKSAETSQKELKDLKKQYDKLQANSKNCEEQLFNEVKRVLTKEQADRVKSGIKAQGTPRVSKANVENRVRLLKNGTGV